MALSVSKRGESTDRAPWWTVAPAGNHWGELPVISRRDVVVGTIVAGALLPSPAFACKAPAPKDRDGYTRLIDRLFDAWWARDFTAFQQAVQGAEGKPSIDARTLFDAHFVKPEHRFRGELLFNGASLVAQVITPQEADPAHGICGGYAVADLFLVSFFPGADTPMVREAKHIDFNLLAHSEWAGLPGALR
jgi:hypothetical protein